MRAVNLGGWLLQGLGLVLYLVGAGTAIGIMAAGHKAARQADNLLLGVLLLLAGLVLATLLLYGGHGLSLVGRRLVARERSRRALPVEPGAPWVLYLRSFRDDDPMSATPTVFTYRSAVEVPSLTTEEEHLARALADLGSFVAIANPAEDEGLPRLGAVRLTAGDGWREDVLGLMDRARLVVFRAGMGEWLWWEIEQAVERLPLQRILFLIPADERLAEDFRLRLGILLGRALPTFPSKALVPASLSAVLFFTPDGSPQVVPLSDDEPRAYPSQPLRAPLRAALRPVFEQLGLRWTPPPIPMSLYFRVLLCGWVVGLCVFSLVRIDALEAVRSVRPEAIHLISFGMVGMLLYILGRFGLGLWVSVKTLAAAFRQRR